MPRSKKHIAEQFEFQFTDMLSILTPEEQEHECIWGTAWRDGEKLAHRPWIKDDESKLLCPLPPIGIRQSLVNENNPHYCASRTLGDFGPCNMKGMCPVCGKPVYEAYPWWDNYKEGKSNPYHDECYKQVLGSDPNNII